jgi:N-acetylglucosamine-6-phosphate deacetylase
MPAPATIRPRVIENAVVWPGDGRSFTGHVAIAGDRIVAVAAGPWGGGEPADVLDARGRAVSPGLVDLMVLGGFDRSILRDDPLDIAREYLPLGVTACQFCTGTLPWEAQVQVGRNVGRARAADDAAAARILGLYLEGPFQHPDFTGASLRENSLPPTPENVARVLDALGGPTTMVNVSPGMPDSPSAVRQFVAAGKTVSMAHSAAPAADVLACVEAGTTVLGHVFDNNSGLIGDSGVQQPTLEHVALDDDRVRFIHLICDGAHVHPLLVRLVLRCRGAGSICLVTDCVPKAGRPDGEFVWDDGRRFVKRHGVGRTDKGGLCGSGLLLPDMLRNFMKFTGLPPHEAIRTVTHNPARSLGLDGDFGLLAPGRLADLCLWADGLVLEAVWRGGMPLPTVSPYAEVRL